MKPISRDRPRSSPLLRLQSSRRRVGWLTTPVGKAGGDMLECGLAFGLEGNTNVKDSRHSQVRALWIFRSFFKI